MPFGVSGLLPVARLTWMTRRAIHISCGYPPDCQHATRQQRTKKADASWPVLLLSMMSDKPVDDRSYFRPHSGGGMLYAHIRNNGADSTPVKECCTVR